MQRDLEFWRFVSGRLTDGQGIVLLVVAESSGSSPGRAGYKIAISADGALCGSIGGGMMEVNLVEKSRELLSEPGAVAAEHLAPRLIEQVHQENSPHASGMICSGRQTIILTLLTSKNARTIEAIREAIDSRQQLFVGISREGLALKTHADPGFVKTSDTDFEYAESLGHEHKLYIVGGGHCALALSELMSKMDFRILIFDDRSELNTIAKNRFADEVQIVESYHEIGDHILSDPDAFVVVMTLGYAFDEVVIRNLIERDFRYFGVLGSKAKMKVLLKTLENEGFPSDRLSRIRTPIGLPINSRTPEEIAVSIAAEIIALKNSI